MSRPEGRRSLAELFADYEGDEDLDTTFVRQVVKEAAVQDPELPSLIRALAIPRWFDAAIVGVVRDDPFDNEGNERLLGLVAEHRFVLSHHPRTFVYHDNTRDALLREWQAEDQRSEFTAINERLADYHSERSYEVREVESHLTEVADVMKKAAPDRFVRLTAANHAELSSSLLESLHHSLQASIQNGFAYFRELVYELERTHPEVCRSMLASTRDHLRRAQAEVDPSSTAWLDYFDARIAVSSGAYDPDRTEGMLGQVVGRHDLPPDLHVWALDDLALLYEARYDLTRALEVRRDVTDNQLGVDAYNDPLRLYNLGSLLWWLDDRDGAVEQFRRVIDLIEDDPDGARRDTGINARLDIGLVLSELGDWPGAFEHLTEAMFRARAEFSDDRWTQGAVAAAWMRALTAYGCRVGATALVEARSYVNDPSWRLSLDVTHLRLLTSRGRLRRARAMLDPIVADQAQHSPEAPTWELDLREASLLESQGRQTEANAIWTRVIDGTSSALDQVVYKGVAFQNRGLGRATLGDPGGALGDLAAASDAATRLGFAVWADQVRIDEAVVLANAGRITEAHSLMDEAAAALAGFPGEVRTSVLTARGELHTRAGEWDQARSCYDEALRMFTTERNGPQQVRMLHELTQLAGDRSDWHGLIGLARRMTEVADELHRLDDISDTSSELLADQSNAEGMRRFCGAPDDDVVLGQVRELVRTATVLDPTNFWLHLNLAIVCAAQHDWSGARDAVLTTLATCPPEVGTVSLHRRLLSYSSLLVRDLRSRNGLAAAIELADDTICRTEGHLPAQDLTEIRAALCQLLALTERPEEAVRAFERAVSALQEGPTSGEARAVEVIGELTSQIRDAEEAWSLVAAFDQDGAGTRASSDDLRIAARTAVFGRFGALVGLADSGQTYVGAPVRALSVECGEALVPFVDSRVDGGTFIYEKIPQMRLRVEATRGVSLPGVHMRGTLTLPDVDIAVEIDEISVARSTVDPAMEYAVRPADLDVWPQPGLVDFHPLSGVPGPWVVVPIDGPATTNEDVIGVADHLAHLIEATARRHLSHFVDTAVVSDMLVGWREQEPDLVAGVVHASDSLSQLRLTWLLKRLVQQSVPLTDWRALMDAVREAGGTSAPRPRLEAACRRAVRTILPGNEPHRRPVVLPDGLEHRITDDDPRVSLELSAWIRGALADQGPWVTLQADEAVRSRVAAAARLEEPVAAVLSHEELS